MKNRNNNTALVSEYTGDNALDVLLTDLTSEVFDVLHDIQNKVQRDDWLVMDIETMITPYELRVHDGRGRTWMVVLADKYEALHFVLNGDLLEKTALIHALHRNHYEQEKLSIIREKLSIIRACLSEGVRTPYSQGIGFRWGVDAEYYGSRIEGLVIQDIYILARRLAERRLCGDVRKLSANTEKISVYLYDLIVELPFDHYPFLGLKILQQPHKELHGSFVQELDIALNHEYDLYAAERSAEELEEEEARLRGEAQDGNQDK